MAEWQQIDTAPFADFMATYPLDCLVWCPEIGGVRVGRVWRYPDGQPMGQANGYGGEWKITHWMPMPEPPTGGRDAR